MSHSLTHCRNCGAELYGEYCWKCGQREGRPNFHFTDVAGELSDDLLRWDSRLWRTLLPLLLRPGYLTREFIEGRRARYVQPFRLYLIISFVSFLTLSLVNLENPLTLLVEPATQQSPPTPDAAKKTTVGQARQKSIEAGIDNPSAREDGTINLDVNDGTNAVSSDDLPGDGLAHAPTDIGIERSAGSEQKSIKLRGENSLSWLRALEGRLEQNARQVAEDPTEFTRQLIDFLPQMMFLLLPLFALLLRIVYLFSPFHYLQHLVFALHFHSFVYLLYPISELLEYTAAYAAGTLLMLGLLLYLPLALRRAYGSSLIGALGKSTVILLAHGLMTISGFVAILMFVLLQR